MSVLRFKYQGIVLVNEKLSETDLAQFSGLFKKLKVVYTLTWKNGWVLKRTGKSAISTELDAEKDFADTAVTTGLSRSERAWIIEALYGLHEEVELAQDESEEERVIEMHDHLFDYEYELLKKYFAYTMLSSGEPQLLMRTSEKYFTVTVIPNFENAIKGMHAEYPEVYAQLDASFKVSPCRRFVAKKKSEKDEDSQDTTVVSLSKWWSDSNVGDRITNDIRMYVKEPATFSNNPETVAFAHFDLATLKKGPTPVFDTWLLQMPEELRPVFKAWVYGVFVEKNRCRQMLYLRDSGYTGKSSFTNAFWSNIGNNMFAGLSKSALDNQFWGPKVYGKRLISFSDSGNTKISQMDKLKQLTGSDPIDVEFKGMQSFTWRPNCRVLVSTNAFPEVHLHEAHQRTRTIYIPMTTTTDKEELRKFCAWDDVNDEPLRDIHGGLVVIGSNLEQEMTDEFWTFIASCEDDYKRLCPNDREIILPKAHAEKIEAQCASVEFDNLTAMANTYLEFGKGKGYRISVTDLAIIRKAIEGETPVSKNDVERYLIDKHCDKGLMRIDGNPVRGFEGVRLNPSWVIERNKLKKVSVPKTSVVPNAEEETFPGLPDVEVSFDEEIE